MKPPVFDPCKHHGEVYGNPRYAYTQGGWYYDGAYRPVEELPKAESPPPEYLAVLRQRREASEPPPPKLKGISVADDDELGVEIRRRRLEDRLARAAEEHAE